MNVLLIYNIIQNLINFTLSKYIQPKQLHCKTSEISETYKNMIRYILKEDSVNQIYELISNKKLIYLLNNSDKQLFNDIFDKVSILILLDSENHKLFIKNTYIFPFLSKECQCYINYFIRKEFEIAYPYQRVLYDIIQRNTFIGWSIDMLPTYYFTKELCTYLIQNNYINANTHIPLFMFSFDELCEIVPKTKESILFLINYLGRCNINIDDVDINKLFKKCNYELNLLPYELITKDTYFNRKNDIKIIPFNI